MKICIVLGTRPEIVKMSPVIKECQKKCIDFFVVHTGQHYSFNMDRVFFNELELPEPEYHLDVGSASHGKQTGRMIEKIEEILVTDPCDVTLVQGDTNTVLAGSIATSKINCRLGHVEAGLRSYDRSMPEEINRIVSDHISDYLFAPTLVSRKNLLDEGLPDGKIFVVGNTVVDAVYQNLKLSKKKKSGLWKELGLREGEYFLVTAHRAENVDNPERFRKILKALDMVSKRHETDVVYPIHPRSMKNIKKFGLTSNHISYIDPLGYLEFLQLLSGARLVLTDSGGIQEEACILNVPCVTLRDNTERPETLEVGSNLLAGVEPKSILSCVQEMLTMTNSWSNPYGKGDSSIKIIGVLEAALV